MQRTSINTLAVGLQDPEAKRQVILGAAVFLLSALVVGLVHAASTTADFMVRMRLYVNPEAARICALARCGLSPVLTVVGFVGCITCLILAFRRAKNTTGKPASLLGLGEASHWSYLMHASILAFIFLMGIVSRPIALHPIPVMVIELTNPELKRSIPPVYTKHSISPNSGTARAHCGRMSNLIARANRTKGVLTVPPHHRALPVVASKLKLIDGSKHNVSSVSSPTVSAALSSAVDSGSLPPPFSSCITSGPNTLPRPRSPCLTASGARIVVGCDILPSPSVDDSTPLNRPAQRMATQTLVESVECKLEAPPDRVVEETAIASQDMGFDRGKYLTTMYESGEAFGLISKNSALEDALGDFVEEEEILPERPPIKFAVLEPEMVSGISGAIGGLPVLSRRRNGDTSNLIPPSPHRVSYRKNVEDMADPVVLSNRTIEEPYGCVLDGPDFGPFMSKLQKKVYRVWYPSRGQIHKERETVLHFSVAKDGTISGLKVFRSCGDSSDDLKCLSSVEKAAPLGALPEGAPSAVEIEFTFSMSTASRTFYGDVYKSRQW